MKNDSMETNEFMNSKFIDWEIDSDDLSLSNIDFKEIKRKEYKKL